MTIHMNRRSLLKAGVLSTVIPFTVSGAASAATQITFERQFTDSDGNPIPNASIHMAYGYRNDDGEWTTIRRYPRTNEEGWMTTTVRGGVRINWGFYKSSEERFLAHRLDDVPHIHLLEDITAAETGPDTGTVQLPEANLLEARAVFANKPGGVENAIPRFGSLNERGSYYASGYSYTTTTEDGHMKLSGADFTGVEMSGRAKIWMYPPTFEPYTEQDTKDIAPYQEVTTKTADVTSKTSIEIDVSRRNGENNPGGSGARK